jgi:hypothetical protein
MIEMLGKYDWTKSRDMGKSLTKWSQPVLFLETTCFSNCIKLLQSFHLPHLICFSALTSSPCASHIAKCRRCSREVSFLSFLINKKTITKNKN